MLVNVAGANEHDVPQLGLPLQLEIPDVLPVQRRLQRVEPGVVVVEPELGPFDGGTDGRASGWVRCARDQGERETGYRACETHQAEIERRELGCALAIGDLHHEDAEREDLHPRSDVGHGEAGPEQTEVAGAECVEQRVCLLGASIVGPDLADVSDSRHIGDAGTSRAADISRGHA